MQFVDEVRYTMLIISISFLLSWFLSRKQHFGADLKIFGVGYLVYPGSSTHASNIQVTLTHQYCCPSYFI